MYRLYVDLLSERQQEREQQVRGIATAFRQSSLVLRVYAASIQQFGNALVYVGHKLESVGESFGQDKKVSFFSEK